MIVLRLLPSSVFICSTKNQNSSKFCGSKSALFRLKKNLRSTSISPIKKKGYFNKDYYYLLLLGSLFRVLLKEFCYSNLWILEVDSRIRFSVESIFEMNFNKLVVEVFYGNNFGFIRLY